jgi:signal transduction histidine kinase
MTTQPDELTQLRFHSELTHQLDRAGDVGKALRIALRLIRDFFGATEACIATLTEGGSSATPAVQLPRKSHWPESDFVGLLGGQQLDLPSDSIFAFVKRRKRPWALIVLRGPATAFDLAALRLLGRIANDVSAVIHRIDQRRIAEVRARIDRKVIEQIRPKDLFYQVLHGLRTLTRYDHSATLFVYQSGPGTLELVAEQIAWEKRKSRRIGLVRPVDESFLMLIDTGDIHGFDRTDDGWREWNGLDIAQLAAALDYGNEPSAPPGRSERSMICAPLVTRDGMIGLLKIAACHPGTLGAYEIKLLESFLPYAALAMQNLERTESLEIGMLEAEKKHAMADLARGVAHDVNNALGAVLPLVQQVIVEVRDEEIDRDELLTDLETIEHSIRATRRIFGRMLTFARHSKSSVGEGDVLQAIESTLAILEDGMRRHSVQVHRHLAPDLPMVRGAQADLDQLILNLATNARDAMPKGGDLHIRATAGDGGVEVLIRDTGVGIPPQNQARILEPFFTTKRDGNGLGLSICRSIVWNVHGKMSFESEVNRGTAVRLQLPLAGQ